MKIKNLLDTDFVNYKAPSMLIETPICSFKCDKECGRQVCQNSRLAAAPTLVCDNQKIINYYYENPLTEAIIFCGLEPFDSFTDILDFLLELKDYCQINSCRPPEIVIYTGYYPEEICGYLEMLKTLDFSFIIKFGRFIPDRPHKFDEILGVELSSDNQFAIELEKLKI